MLSLAVSAGIEPANRRPNCHRYESSIWILASRLDTCGGPIAGYSRIAITHLGFTRKRLIVRHCAKAMKLASIGRKAFRVIPDYSVCRFLAIREIVIATRIYNPHGRSVTLASVSYRVPVRLALFSSQFSSATGSRLLPGAVRFSI